METSLEGLKGNRWIKQQRAGILSRKAVMLATATLMVFLLPSAASAATLSAQVWDETLAQRRNWWSLQPVRTIRVPEVRNPSWSEHPVDRLILSRLEAAGLAPSESSDRRTLIRRLSIVLTGLPPSPDETRAFAESESPSAYEQLVDRLLASPGFGERWARHWLDVVRFSETHGNEWNYEVHHAWRYRDYLIRAFNQDLPYDQFIREHIVGDLLAHPRWNREEQFNESVIGTAFYRFGEVNHDDCIGLPQIGYDLADNQIDTLTKAFQATTVACARCHNHKIDAVSMKDYHALLGILRSSRQVSHLIDAPEINESTVQELSSLKRKIRQEIADLWIQDASEVHHYLLTAQAGIAGGALVTNTTSGLDPNRLQHWIKALTNNLPAMEEPLSFWRALHPTNQSEAQAIRSLRKDTASKYAREQTERADFNRTNFVAFADFQSGSFAQWHVGGQGLRMGPARGGDFTLHSDGDAVIETVLPAGVYTHLISQRLNGTLRSPPLTNRVAKMSFQVMGRRSSALRLVSNNCQLNYKNYRALTTNAFEWVTFSPPDDAESLRVYAELMTMFDNPKFPDQLSALGGDKADYKVPWAKAAEDPRSYFGITRAVTHSTDAVPKPELTHLESLWSEPDLAAVGLKLESTLRSHSLAPRGTNGARVAVRGNPIRPSSSPRPSPPPSSEEREKAASVSDADFLNSRAVGSDVSDEEITDIEAADRYRKRILEAITRWKNDDSTDDDVVWLDFLVKHGLLRNRCDESTRLSSLITAYRKAEGRLALPRVVPGMGDFGPGFEQPILARGDCTKPLETVPRRYLEVIEAQFSPAQLEGSGRLQLAERIAHSQNPLTARVMVNRIWKHLFGEGLVRTVDDFGQLGDAPSQPELLDYLAGQFMRENWSIKGLIRTIVLSKTFQTSARPSPTAREIDPQNRLLQHYPARRMEAEAIRDCILAVSGRLDRSMYGMSVQPYRENENADRRLFAGPLDGQGRRSVYIKANLMESPKFLSAFSIPGGKVCQGRRDTANVPAQSLALLNDPLVLQQADGWARQLITRRADSFESRIDYMFEAAFGRAMLVSERNRFVQAAERLAELRGLGKNEMLLSPELWKDLAHSLFNMKEFIFIP